MAISYGRTDIETPIHADIKETISHGIIVSNLAYLVGKELGLQEEVCYDLAVAGMLHDLGKVRLNFYMNEKVEDEILAVDETRYMRMHPSIGYREGFDVETALDIMIDEVKNFDMKVFLAFQRVAFSDGVMETVMEKGNLDELFEEEQE